MKKLFLDSPIGDRKAFNSIIIAVILTILYQTFHTFFPAIVGLLVSMMIIAFCVRGLVTFYKYHRMNPWGKWFLFLIIYFLLVGILHGGPFTHNIVGLMLSQDIRYVLFFLIGSVFAFDDNMRYFHQIMRIIGIISIVFGVLSFITYSPTLQSVESREGTWTISYYYWWCSSACFFYWGYYTLFVKQDTRIGYGVMITYVVLGLLFLKRAAVIDFAVVLLFYVIFAKKTTGYFKPLLFIAIGVVILILYKGSFINSIFDLITGRFNFDFDEFDRAIESNNYFARANFYDIIFGNGIGHYYDSISIRDKDEVLNALHLGWANIIYKGGVFYALYMLALYTCIVLKVFHLPDDDYGKVCLGVAISTLASMFYAGSWTYAIVPFCISAPIFYIVTRRSNY